MDSYETLNKAPKFNSLAKFGKSAGLKNEACNLKADQTQSTKPMKYYTQNFFDNEIGSCRGVFFHSGFNNAPPFSEIGIDNNLRMPHLTNVNLPQSLPSLPLPTTAGYSKGQGPVEIEDTIRPLHNREKNQCQPKAIDFYTKHFYIFDNMPIVPNKCVKNVVQEGAPYRQGVSTRHSNSTSYKR